MPIRILLASLLLGSIVSPSAAGDGRSGRPLPSPRRSGQGAVAFEASNIQLLGWLTLDQLGPSTASGSDCWGYTSPSGREYALVGTSSGTAFVEVTDPGSPRFLVFRGGPLSPWRAIEVFGDNAYVVSEGGGGIQIFDLSAIDSGTVTLVNTVLAGGCTTASHNVAIDTVSGFLYRCGGGTAPCGGEPQGLVVYDLNANPDDPPVVGAWTSSFVSDCQVLVSNRPGTLGHQLAFCAAQDTSAGGSPRLEILDVTEKTDIQLLSSLPSSSSGIANQTCLTEDQRFLYLSSEGTLARTTIFNVVDPFAPFNAGSLSEPVGESVGHNAALVDNRLFKAHLRAGLHVYDTTMPRVPSLFASFDTYEVDDAAGYSGLWGCYPFFPSGTVIGSDTQKGLFVWRLGPARLRLQFTDPLPELLAPDGDALAFRVDEESAGADLVPGSVELHWSTGGAFTSTPAMHLQGAYHLALFPALPCGATVQYFVSARSTGGVTWTDPPAGVTQVHQAVVGYGKTVAHLEDFETDTGWQVDLPADLAGLAPAEHGAWIRGDPVGTEAQPEDDHSPLGTQCFVTANAPPTSSPGDSDIDLGTTTLRSPVLDASGLADPYISYWRWFSNTVGPAPNEDSMTVQISNNGGASWRLLETVGPTGPDADGGWIQHRARIAGILAPTSNMRLRLRVGDLGSGSIVEAALDDVELYDADCTFPALALASVTPSTGSMDGDEIVALRGTGFTPGCTVSFGPNAAAAVQFVTSTTLRVRVPRWTGSVSGRQGRVERRADVTVSNGTAVTLEGAYTYQLGQKL